MFPLPRAASFFLFCLTSLDSDGGTTPSPGSKDGGVLALGFASPSGEPQLTSFLRLQEQLQNLHWVKNLKPVCRVRYCESVQTARSQNRPVPQCKEKHSFGILCPLLFS